MKKEIGFGTYKMGKDQTVESVKEAIKNKYDFIDTAFKYENETLVGEGINTSINPNIKIQTKLWITHFNNAREQFMSQLEMLGKKKIWSLLLHRPTFDFYDCVKAWKVLIDLKREGLVEKIGVSNFDKDMLIVLFKETGVMPEINQIELSVTNFRDDRVDFANKNNIQIQAWTPLGVSGLTNKKVNEIALKHKATPAHVCIAFLLQQGIIPIVKSETAKRIQENIRAKNLELSSEEINELRKENIYENKASETFYYK